MGNQPAGKTPSLPESFVRWVKDLPNLVWEGSKKRVVSLIVGAIFGAVTFGFGVLWGLAFPEETTTVANQDSYGAHCLNTFFDRAEDDGATLAFEPESLRNVMLCGVPLIGEDTNVKTLEKVLTQLDQCFDAERGGELAWTVKANLAGAGSSGDVSSVTGEEHLPYFACRCPQEMQAILARDKTESWCGLDAPEPEAVLPALRDLRIKW